MAPDRSPPHALDSEHALLGAALHSPSALDRVGDLVTPDDFIEPVNGHIFKIMCQRREAGEVVDLGLMRAVLGNSDLGGQTVGEYLAHLMASATTIVGAPGYARMIRDAAGMRRVLATCEDGAAEMTAGSIVKPGECAARMIEALDEVASADLAASVRRVKLQDASASVLARLEAARREGKPRRGVTYGLPSLDRVLLGMRRSQFIVVAARPAMGKAQPVGSRIHTPNGWRPMGDLAVGDEVSSVDGASSCITGIFDQGVKQVFRVRFSDGRETRCCAEHLWEVSYRDWMTPRIIDTSRLIEMLGKIRYRNRLSIRMHSGDLGRDAELPLHPWLLGVALGHGSLARGSVHLGLFDEAIRVRVAQLLPSDHKLSHRSHDEYTVISEGGPNQIRNSLINLGLLGCRSAEKRIPKAYMESSRGDRLALLQGILDTDGWVEKKGSARYSSASAGLASDVIELARSLGLWAKYSSKAAYVGSYEAGRTRKLDAHQVCISGAKVSEIFTLERKAERLRDRSWFRALTIASIEPDGSEACRCISVSHPSQLYVTDDHIVTHNTALAVHIGIAAARSAGPVAMFSLEMDGEELAERVLSALAYDHREPEQITYNAIIDGMGLSDQAMGRLRDAQRRCGHIPLWIEQQPALSIAQIAARARQMKLKAERGGAPLSAIIIDHIGLIRPSGRYSGNRVQEVTEISSALKGLAKEMGLPVVALCQLNREVEKRDDKHPKLSDLRESGSIEQDADVVLGVFRESYYLSNRTDLTAPESDRLVRLQNVMEIEVLKQRSGSTPRIEVFCEIGCNILADKASW